MAAEILDAASRESELTHRPWLLSWLTLTSPPQPLLFEAILWRAFAPEYDLLKPSKPVGRSMVTGIQALMPVADFGWDDVIQAAERDDDDPSDLRGYFKGVRSCNRGSELQTQFFPILVEDEVV